MRVSTFAMAARTSLAALAGVFAAVAAAPAARRE
jgi:hypothetical protein